jgi:hypothetical protein
MASNASNEFATISEIIKTARMNLTQARGITWPGV